MKTVCEVRISGNELGVNAFLLALYETYPYVLDQKIRVRENVYKTILSFSDQVTKDIIDSYLFHRELKVQGITWIYH